MLFPTVKPLVFCLFVGYSFHHNAVYGLYESIKNTAWFKTKQLHLKTRSRSMLDSYCYVTNSKQSQKKIMYRQYCVFFATASCVKQLKLTMATRTFNNTGLRKARVGEKSYHFTVHLHYLVHILILLYSSRVHAISVMI